MAQEQLALAHNRIAEKLAGPDADERRREALGALDAIPKEKWTSETYGILGRIHKGHADAEVKAAGNDASRQVQVRSALTAAIKAYEAGFRADPRDYYPGVNAVTLRILRNLPEDEGALADLLPGRTLLGRPRTQPGDQGRVVLADRHEAGARCRRPRLVRRPGGSE